MSIVLETLIRHFEREPNAVMWPNGIALRHGEIAAVLRHHALPVADRLRELEAQLAASEPVAWADRLADAVRKLVRVLNDGDDVSALALALEATEKALAQFDDSKRCCGLCDAGECKYEIAPPSAAAVRVTEAMVEAAAKVGCDNGFDRDFDAPGMYWDAMHEVVTAAVTAASEGESA